LTASLDFPMKIGMKGYFNIIQKKKYELLELPIKYIVEQGVDL